jgi:uncharacterized protein (DUF924 family)
MKPSPDDILEFWYTEPASKHWFNSTPELDELIRSRYQALWQQAKAGDLDEWMQTPEGCLALVIILDQFPLNMFRGRPESFATEQQAVEVAGHALEQGFDKQIPKQQIAFLYMPFMHSESLEDQDRCVALFEAVGLEDNLKFARHHREIVRRFGRFPHRNVILGRQSTEEELRWLESDEAFKG